jgi:hypothetical protein
MLLSTPAGPVLTMGGGFDWPWVIDPCHARKPNIPRPMMPPAIRTIQPARFQALPAMPVAAGDLAAAGLETGRSTAAEIVAAGVGMVAGIVAAGVGMAVVVVVMT